MEVEEKQFYWCETPEANAIFTNKSEMIEGLKELVHEQTDMNEVDIWSLKKISSENFRWEEVTLGELMEEVLKDG